MDDQRGNVIDGTARARQWRLARSKARAAADGDEARSDAPKSIAGSLLVPADMLPAAFPGERPHGHARSGVTGRPPQPGTPTVDRPPDRDARHQNPFLVPDAAVAAGAGRPARRRQLAAWLTRLVGVGLRQRAEHARERLGRQSARERRPHPRLRRWPIVSAAVLSVTAVSVIAIASQTSHTTPKTHKTGVLAARSRSATVPDTTAQAAMGAVEAREDQVGNSPVRRRALAAHRRPRHQTRAHPRSSRSHRTVSTTARTAPVAVHSSTPGTSSSSSSPSYPRTTASEPASAGTTSSAQPAGPAGPGGTVGSNCNPKCS
jgi:hypothetical protein